MDEPATIQYMKAGASGMLDVIKPWLEDKTVSEIMINRPGELFIEKNGLIIREENEALSQLYLRRLFNFIANESNQVLNEQHPLLSANLYDGSRVQLVIPPAAKSYTLSIRRKSIKSLKLVDYKDTSFFKNGISFCMNQPNHLRNDDSKLQFLYNHREWHAFLQEAIQAKKNIVISGGTSSGKTTFLNALISEIPLDERIITLEDTREVSIPHQNHVSLLASKGGQGASKISMQDLLQSSLRLRPDRIIMGEIRGAEIMDFVNSCSTGHEGSMTSIHANNPKIAIMRMTQMYKLNNVPSMRDKDILQELNEVIDIIIQVGKTPRGREMLHCYYKGASI